MRGPVRGAFLLGSHLGAGSLRSLLGAGSLRSLLLLLELSLPSHGCATHRQVSALCRRRPVLAAVLLAACAALAGCGSRGSGASPGATPVFQAHPQAIEPAAGVGSGNADASGNLVGDVNAHAPPLAEVKRQLHILNLCGGTTNPALAAPLVRGRGPGFVADPGTSQTEGELPLLTSRLDQLAKALGVVIYGISGYRRPQHSVAVGGFANDPHTLGLAEDLGVGSLLRSSAARISETQLARFGLYRPFDPSNDPNNAEVNHVQLIPAGGALSLSQAQGTYNPDPACQ